MVALLKNKQIAALFASGLIVLFTGMGLFPVLPLYAGQFEASNSMIGFYFAAMYAANALAPAAAGWLAARFSKRALFIAGGVMGTPVLALLAAAKTFPQLVALTSLLWFAGGLVMSVASILTGLAVDEGSRGKAFSLMAMVGPAGALAGGAAVGSLVAWQGYATMFAALAVVWTAVPLIGLLALKDDDRPARKAAARSRPRVSAARLGAGFAWVTALSFVGAMAVNVSRLGTSLSMQALDFTPDAVAGAGMMSGLVAIPGTLAIGALSDRLGRKHFMSISYMLAVSGALILFNAAALWQFWLASALLMLAYSVSGAMAQAMTGDLVPAESMTSGLSYLNAFMAGANILTFAVGGVLIDLLGLPAVFLIAALLGLSAGAGIETLIRPARQAPELPNCCEA